MYVTLALCSTFLKAEKNQIYAIRWDYGVETDKEGPVQPFCIMLSMTHRGQHSRLLLH